MLITIALLISATGHMAVADIYTCLLPRALCPQQAPQRVVNLCLVRGPKHSFLSCLGH